LVILRKSSSSLAFYVSQSSALLILQQNFKAKIFDLLKLNSRNPVHRHQLFGGKSCLHLQILRVIILDIFLIKLLQYKKVKVKVKVLPITGHEGPEGE
jgi:hypothetical protein